MAKITKSYEPDIDLTIFTVMGKATFDEISDQTRKFLSGKPSKFALWDFTSGTLTALSNQELEKIAILGGMILGRIKGGKAAIVATEDIDYGISRIFQVFSDIDNFPLEIEIFRDMIAARKWLTTENKVGFHQR